MEKLKNNMMTVLVTVALAISAFYSARSIVIEKETYMDSYDVYFQAGMFMLLGLLVAASFWIIEDRIKKHKNWQVSVVIAILLSGIWLFISPKQNALTFSHREAVVNEIKDQYKIIEATVTPFTDRYESYSKLSGELASISQEIRSMKAEQALSTKGRFWRMLDNIDSEISPSVKDFNSNFGKKSKTAVTAIKKDLKEISSLEYKEDKEYVGDDVRFYNSSGLIKIYSDKRLDIQSNIAILKDADNPRLILATILTKLKGFQTLVDSVKKSTKSKHIKEIAEHTSRRVDPLVSSFSLKVQQANDKSKKLEAELDKIDKITFDTITLNVALVDKHWKKYYPQYLGTQLLDYIPITAMFYSIFILVSSRKKLRLEAKRDIKQSKLEKENQKLEKILDCKTKPCKELEEKKEDLEKQEAQKSANLELLRKRHDEDIEKLKDSLSDLKIEMIKEITRLENEQIVKEREVGGDISELEDVKNNYDTLRANVDSAYDVNVEEYSNRIEDIVRDYQSDMDSEETRSNKDIDKSIATIKEMQKLRTIRVESAKANIQELEEDIEEFEDEIAEIEAKEFSVKGEKNEN